MYIRPINYNSYIITIMYYNMYYNISYDYTYEIY